MRLVARALQKTSAQKWLGPSPPTADFSVTGDGLDATFTDGSIDIDGITGALLSGGSRVADHFETVLPEMNTQSDDSPDSSEDLENANDCWREIARFLQQ